LKVTKPKKRFGKKRNQVPFDSSLDGLGKENESGGAGKKGIRVLVRCRRIKNN
jgi:hypothetical protein